MRVLCAFGLLRRSAPPRLLTRVDLTGTRLQQMDNVVYLALSSFTLGCCSYSFLLSFPAQYGKQLGKEPTQYRT
jgi:hypothetical protein